MHDAPTDIKLKRADCIVEVSWRNETLRRHRARTLRCACRCAACVDERTGVRTLDVDAVPNDIGVTKIELVGNYAMKFTFSDGHDTGICSWERLYGMPSE